MNDEVQLGESLLGTPCLDANGLRRCERSAKSDPRPGVQPGRPHHTEDVPAAR